MIHNFYSHEDVVDKLETNDSLWNALESHRKLVVFYTMLLGEVMDTSGCGRNYGGWAQGSNGMHLIG